jgi:hypothetical protein
MTTADRGVAGKLPVAIILNLQMPIVPHGSIKLPEANSLN